MAVFIALLWLGLWPAAQAKKKVVPPAPAPEARVGAAMATAGDSAVVLFGGEGAGGVLGDTWTFDGTSWTKQAPTTSPPPRAGAAMAFDGRTGMAILFGGRSGDGSYLDDTWAWNGSGWTQQLTAAVPPPARADAVLAFDEGQDNLVLFGGRDGERVLGDTWTWTAVAWKPEATVEGAPSARHSAGAASVNGTVVLSGGAGGSEFPSDTLSWDGGWTRLHRASGVYERSGHSMSGDIAAGRGVVFGGRNSLGTLFDDTWVWDGENWVPDSPVVRPAARAGASMAYLPATQSLVLFGGQGDTALLADTWTLSGSLWVQR